MDKPHYYEHRKRLKERFQKAPEAAHDAEILELLLGYVIPRKDTKPLAKEILARAKNIGSVFEGDLMSIKGIGPETVLFFNVLREYINRSNFQKIKNKAINLSLSGDVHNYLKTKIGHCSNEAFAILFLDGKNRLKDCKIIRTGFINSVAIHARDIISHSIANNAQGVIIAHNHPSGDPSPSPSDIKVTRQICYALRHTGITLLDHMIVAYHEYYSMNANGEIARFYKEADEMMNS